MVKSLDFLNVSPPSILKWQDGRIRKKLTATGLGVIKYKEMNRSISLFEHIFTQISVINTQFFWLAKPLFLSIIVNMGILLNCTLHTKIYFKITFVINYGFINIHQDNIYLLELHKWKLIWIYYQHDMDSIALSIHSLAKSWKFFKCHSFFYLISWLYREDISPCVLLLPAKTYIFIAISKTKVQTHDPISRYTRIFSWVWVVSYITQFIQ